MQTVKKEAQVLTAHVYHSKTEICYKQSSILARTTSLSLSPSDDLTNYHVHLSQCSTANTHRFINTPCHFCSANISNPKSLAARHPSRLRPVRDVAITIDDQVWCRAAINPPCTNPDPRLASYTPFPFMNQLVTPHFPQNVLGVPPSVVLNTFPLCSLGSFFLLRWLNKKNTLFFLTPACQAARWLRWAENRQ